MYVCVYVYVRGGREKDREAGKEKGEGGEGRRGKEGKEREGPI